MFKLIKNKKGFGLVEIILSSMIFVLFLSALVTSFLYGLESTAFAGDRVRAMLLAQEGVEAVRSLRNWSFLSLVDGVHGLALSGNQYVLTNTPDTVGVFTRTITISTVDQNTKKVEVKIDWLRHVVKQNILTSTTYFTKWTLGVGQANDLVVDSSQVFTKKNGKDVRGIFLKNQGTSDIVITSIQVSWNNGNLIEEIKIGGTKVWRYKGGIGSPPGRQSSGTILDIVDYTLQPGQNKEMRMKFTGDMRGSVITLIFTMIDGSQKQAVIDLSDTFRIDTSSAILGKGGKELRGIVLSNIGNTNLIIDKIQISWNNNNLVEEIKIGGTKVWKYKGGVGSPQGRQPSGTVLDIVNYTLLPGSNRQLKVRFNGNMSGSIFTIVFTLTDGTQKQVVVDLSETFKINTSGASITGGGGKNVDGIILSNYGTTNIVIDKIQVTWSNNNLIEEMKLKGKKVWDEDGKVGSPAGKQSSGTLLDIKNYTLKPGRTANLKMEFTGNMTGSTMTILFILTDGTQKQVSFSL